MQCTLLTGSNPHQQHDDFLQLMLDLETENGSTQNATPTDLFSNNDLISHCITFLLAGQETTASCLAYTSYLLAINPDVQEKLCQELDNYFKDHSVSISLLTCKANAIVSLPTI